MKKLAVFTQYILLFTLFACGQNKQGQGGLLDVNTFEEKINAPGNKQIVDVRTAEEVSGGFIPGAQNIDIYDPNFAQAIEKLDKKVPVYVYCKAGGRSATAAEQFRKAGFTEVYDLKGGFMGWENAGKTIATSETPVSKTEVAVAALPHHIYNKQQFDSITNGALPVLIDFYAQWCAPCKRMAPSLEKLRSEYEGKALVIKMDVDQAKDLAKALGIESLPILRTYKNGKEIANKTGFQSEEDLRKMLDELLK